MSEREAKAFFTQAGLPYPSGLADAKEVYLDDGPHHLAIRAAGTQAVATALVEVQEVTPPVPAPRPPRRRPEAPRPDPSSLFMRTTLDVLLWALVCELCRLALQPEKFKTKSAMFEAYMGALIIWGALMWVLP